MRKRDFGVFHSRVSAVSISEAASPAPSCLQRILNGRSVTPAIGARTTVEGRVYGPIFTLVRERLVRDVVGTRYAIGWSRQAGFYLEAHCVGPRIDKRHLGIDALTGRQQGRTGYCPRQVGLWRHVL